ncbi:photosystem II manganese-stabilizing polypeptide [Synechococcus elongatus]|uniref:Photosystem II extrinsic protein O n=2 Tax=Synechococcus elongatus TaxID=32046 RepID=PSBO_SYNE7|nr:photosystem II manganese-stabilizing polypeptide [Synechococcus elongatus]P11472.1 RecName: Full=Photosystem II extrinsic protein O; Short=PsbO; AltName: Full=Photosystem II manganese-stabilizing polypeptide; Short=MSP; Flags: Precursor [Synechococcus elongatus PCC 7942 = FACHB-805]pir/A39964/ photosystem II oxygen-evolving complex protein 1 precursor - Synechococcus sp [Synechococcus sp.]AAA87283.1 Mn-stabilizing protein precursor [Synechococcus elongatus PCC 7942 = FACHB-805]ABB56326.1 pho
MRYRAFLAAFLAVCLGVLTACSSGPTAADLGTLTYDQIKDTGLANKCLSLKESARGTIPLEAGKKYALTDLCLEPQEFFVKEEPGNKRQKAEFVPGKVLTRYTSSLDQVYGDLALKADGTVSFTEKGGIDFQAITVLLPGGEEVPFLFTVKGLVASTSEPATSINTSTDLRGGYRVPSYRTSNFLDPKARGLTTGYESAVAIPSAGDAEDLTKENVKRFVTGQGEISLAVSKVDGATGEVAGVFTAIQPSDTDMGGKEAVDVKLVGQFYGRIEPADA